MTVLSSNSDLAMEGNRIHRVHARFTRFLASVCAPSPRSWVFLAILLWLPLTGARADEAEWIWASGTSAEESIDVGESCYFRKIINMRVSGQAKIEIAADDEYELFINGNAVGVGSSSRTVDEYDVGDYFEVGRNIIAVKVKNRRGDTAALAARVSVRPSNANKWYTFSSDRSWKTSQEPSELWETVAFNDRLWNPAASFGPLGDTAPWDHQEPIASTTGRPAAPAPLTDRPQTQRPAASSQNPSSLPAQQSLARPTPPPQPTADQRERFQIQKGFGVQRVLSDKKIGSVIAMTFNEFGHLLISQENGPLLLAFDDNEDGIPETVRTYCDKVKSCQGILALNGNVYVTADGPQGAALYKLSDTDRNGSLEQVKAIVKFVDQQGRPAKVGEHGAHGLRLGPDGMIYVAVGSHVQAAGKTGDGETYLDPYEGDLLPRYEDPGGYANGIKAPGGTIIRTNPSGSVVEKVAGGLRNPYDLVFHSGGALFVHDADMEADTETAWYRPNAVFDVTEGGEFGWRTGWAKWPDYYYDRLPNMIDTGRGSPTGGVCYEHYAFPMRYQGTLFLGDWSEGRILNVRVKKRGASFVADSEVFLQGQPLNVTDLEVGPDGALYFCTGGRSTAGGVYRVIYKGKIPDRMKKLGTGIAAAVRQPQIESAWTRQKIASIKRDLGDQWNQLVAGVAYSDDNPPDYRVRAMNLMQLFGPIPSEELLLELSESESELVRAKAALMLGRSPSDQAKKRLETLLSDADLPVQRAAGESLLRAGELVTEVESVLPLLASDDRTLAFVGRRLLERLPPDAFRSVVLEANDNRIAIVGMLALVSADPSEATGLSVLERASEMMSGFLSDADFIDLLRLCQVTLHRTKVDAEKVATLREQVAEEFPAGEPRINHEVIRLASYLGSDSLADRALEYIQSDAPFESRTLVAMCLQSMSQDWNAKQRFAILKFFEQAANRSTSGALAMYMTNVTRDFASTLTADDLQAILEQGHVWRNAALAAIYKVERPINSQTAQTLMTLDKKIRVQEGARDVQRRLRTGIVALLATAEDPEAADYLRTLWRQEPQRRAVISIALSVNPGGENWDYLVRSLNIVDDDAAEEVVRALIGVPIATDDPTALRQLILLGVRAETDGRPFKEVERLLEHWTGMERPSGGEKSMRPWQKWYAKVYPDRPPAVPPRGDESRWDFEQLVGYLDGSKGRVGDPHQGKLAFTKARCAECHRFGNYGESIGPSLSGIARRFTKREIVESILYPAHVVSDQYASKKILALDGKVLVGMVSEQSDGTLSVRDARNNLTVISADDVDQILPSSSSTMPTGLLDDLTLQEISDLMAYLGVLPNAEIARQPQN
ncbi:MAG: HEAT repeat domain-containing protein [Planctomycetota bacterium]